MNHVGFLEKKKQTAGSTVLREHEPRRLSGEKETDCCVDSSKGA